MSNGMLMTRMWDLLCDRGRKSLFEGCSGPDSVPLRDFYGYVGKAFHHVPRFESR